MNVPLPVIEMAASGALFVVNHSGGKDSQAMLIKLREVVPDDQIAVVHAHLPEVEWDGIEAHIRYHSWGLPFYVALARKTFFEMVEHRQMFPSPSHRQCTSDLKRGPIEKVIRQICRDRGITRVVNCMGMRAQESASRAKQQVLRANKSLSKAGRQVLDWLPIHGMTEAEVFQTISDAGQQPHWAYAAGMTRLSCCFCIMANKGDLETAARLQPKLYQRYVATERRLGSTLSPSQRFLPEITGVAA